MPQGEYNRIANKDEILRMYDRTMMSYLNYVLKHNSAEMHKGLITETTMQNYVGKIEVLRIILGFNGNMEEK